MVTPASFKARFPEFSSESDDRVQLFINDTTPFFNVARWDDLLDLGVSYLTAHNLALANLRAQQGAAGQIDDAVIGVELGDYQKTKDAKSLNEQSHSPYLRTYYGQQYLYYANLAGAGAIAV